ncbi:MAG: copper resistance protein CopC [Dehalococcoidia bacterium]|nr:copper resistance protein CopC [Dehalococcoidia bacterium]
MTGRFAGLALLAVLLVVLISPRQASAHASLVASEPAENAFLRMPPGEISLTFSEPIAAESSTIRLLDATGSTIRIAPPLFPADGHTMRAELEELQPGIYNVLWSNVSRVDGHALRGSYPFTVLNPDGTTPAGVNLVPGFGDGDPTPLADGVAVRALELLGLLLAAGGTSLLLLWGEGARRARQGLVVCVCAGAGLMVAATLLHLAILDREYSGHGTWELVTGTRVGFYWLLRFVAALVAVAAATGLTRASRAAPWAVLAGLAAHAWGLTATSHAAAGTGRAIAMSLDFAHGAAAVAWMGAVVGLALAVRLSGRNARYGDLMPRFSLAASVLVFVVIVTGALNAMVEVDSRTGLRDTRYGVTLLVKLGLLVPLLAVAAYNARRGRRRLVGHAKGEPRRFIVLATVEVALGLAVFVAAAMLTQTAATKSIVVAGDAGPYERTINVDGVAISLRVSPNRTGLNSFEVDLSGGGFPEDEAERVRLTFRYLEDATVGTSTLDLSSGYAPGTYLAQGPYLPLEGQWRVEVSVRGQDANDLVAPFDVRPAGSPVSNLRRGGAWSNPAPGLSWNEFGGLAFLFAGLGFALWRKPLRRLGRRGGMGANALMIAGFGAGILLLFGVHRHEPAGGIPTNPIFPDQNSISAGRRLYEQNCVACHGANGIPPKGLELNPYPLDLTVHVSQHPDGQIYRFISRGIPGTAMRAWSEGAPALSEDEIWHLVNYLRTAFTPADR